jgi:hypothetical protein
MDHEITRSREMCGKWKVWMMDECRHLNVARLDEACPSLPGGCGIEAHWSVKGSREGPVYIFTPHRRCINLTILVDTRHHHAQATQAHDIPAYLHYVPPRLAELQTTSRDVAWRAVRHRHRCRGSQVKSLDFLHLLSYEP